MERDLQEQLDAIVPAPWQLRASGYVLTVQVGEEVARSPRHAAPSALPGALGRWALVMFVDYADSPVGPYRELLYIPDALHPLLGARPAISKIYVSSEASVRSGRANWGIPKELAAFELASDARGRQSILMEVEGQAAFRLEISSANAGVPVSTAVLPRRPRTLRQQLDGRLFFTTLSARGRACPAHVHRVQVEPSLFPCFATPDVRAAIAMRDVAMTFPRPRVERAR